MNYLKILFFLALFSQSSDLYANVQINATGCAGVVFKMPNMTDDQKALVLTNGHCIGYGSYSVEPYPNFPDNKEVFINFNTPFFETVTVYSDNLEWDELFYYQKILFATMTDTDLAIIELETTYKTLKEKNYTVYSIAREFPRLGTIMEFYTYSYNKIDICKVDKIIPTLKEGVWTWNDSIRMKANEECRFIPGQSGTAGIEPSSGLVYGLANTGYEGGTPCSFGNPCEIHKEIISTGERHQSYGVSVAPLYDCYDEDQAVFNFNPESCSLNRQ